jgi:hypothetical protein
MLRNGRDRNSKQQHAHDADLNREILFVSHLASSVNSFTERWSPAISDGASHILQIGCKDRAGPLDG